MFGQWLPCIATREIPMNKKSTGVKRVKLSLSKETVLNLTSDMLKNVAGGMIPETRISACYTACIKDC
jgi:hypothetical protein